MELSLDRRACELTWNGAEGTVLIPFRSTHSINGDSAMAQKGLSGIWRDGNRAVINLSSYAFSDRCLLTAESTCQAPSEIELTCFRWLPFSPKGDNAYTRSIASIWTLGPFQLVNLNLRLPMTFVKRGQSHRLGGWLFISGGVLAVVGMIASIVGVAVWDLPVYLVPVSVIIGFAMSTTAATIMLRRHAPLTVRRLAGEYLWLNGLHPQVLAEFTAWNKTVEFHNFVRRQVRTRSLGGVVAVAISAIILIVKRQELPDALASRNWITVAGQITSSQIVEHRPDAKDADRQQIFEHLIAYSFNVNGIAYSGTRIDFGKPLSSRSQFEAERLQKQEFAVGRNVSVYHDPVDPRRCSLSKAGKLDVIYIAGPIMFAVIVGVSLFIMAALAYRTTRT